MKEHRILLITAVALVVILIGAAVGGLLIGPSQGNITAVATTPVSSVPDSPLINVQTGQASFGYPADFSSQPPELATPPVLFSQAYIKPVVTHWRLAVSILSVQESTLSDDSGYALRVSQPAQYQPSTQVINGIHFTVMHDTQAGGYSAVAYTLDNLRVGEIAISGDDQSNGGTLQPLFQSVLKSWHWDE
jgi:hypothetical protein